MFGFFQRHIIAGIGLLVGPAIAIGSLVLHAYALHEMGIPLEIWVAIGLAIFFASTVGILYKWWDENQKTTFAAVAQQSFGNNPIISSPKIEPPENLNTPSAEIESASSVNCRTITPEDIREIYRDRTTAEADRIVTAYIGKWFSVYGTVRNVSKYRPDGVIVFLGKFPVTYRFDFPHEETERIESLRVGDAVGIGGTLVRVSRDEVELTDCDLLEPRQTPSG